MNKNMILSIAKRCFHRSQNVMNTQPMLLKKGAIIMGTGFGSVLALQPLLSKEEINTYLFAAFRFLRSLQIGMTISMDYYFSMLGLDESSANFAPMMSIIHKRAANRILNGCLANGGTYIKLGQGLVSMSHILPKEYIDILTALQDKCLVRSGDELCDIFSQDFERKPSEMYKCIEPKPFAAASLSQVFKGVTLDGETVAIKVQYIDLQSRFISDVATIDFLLKVIGFIHSDFNFGWVFEDLTDSLRQELDFVNEAKNSERCAKDLSHLSYVYVPKVRWDLTSTRVLVTEMIDGIKINDIEQLQSEGLSLSDIDTKVIEAFGHQIFQTGFVHADPHPGNILIRKKNKEAEIVLLDHGLYQELTEEHKEALSFMWKAIVFQNFKDMKTYSNILGVKDYEIFAEVLTQRPIRSSNFKLTTRLTEEEIQYMTDAAQHRFDKIMAVLRDMPRSLLLVVRNLNTIRAITHDHGDPVDRYALLARSATKTAFKTKTTMARILRIPVDVYFEFKMITGRIWVWFIKIVAKLMTFIGRSPDMSVLLSQIN